MSDATYKQRLQKTWDNDARHRAIMNTVLQKLGYVDLGKTTDTPYGRSKFLLSVNKDKLKRLYDDAEQAVKDGKLVPLPRVVGQDYAFPTVDAPKLKKKKK